MTLSRPGVVVLPTSYPARKRWPSARSSTASPPREVIRLRWRARPPEAAPAYRVRVSVPLKCAPPAQADDAIVDVRDVHYEVDGRAIFSGLNITARRGRITAVMGPSGTGKTTLLRLITAQIPASSGCVAVLGQDLGQADKEQIY